MANDEIKKNLNQKVTRILIRLSLFCIFIFSIISIMNFKSYTSVLIGAGSFEFFDIFRGVTYVAFYFATITFVPIVLKFLDKKMSTPAPKAADTEIKNS